MKKTAGTGAVDERLFLQSVARALDVLEAFAQSPPKSLGEIAAATGVNKSAAQRIGQTLLARGYLERSENGRLTLGRRLLDRSFDYLRSNPLVERATPVLMDLRKLTGERVDLSLFDEETTVYAIRLQSKRETFYATLPGRRIPTFLSSAGAPAWPNSPMRRSRPSSPGPTCAPSPRSRASPCRRCGRRSARRARTAIPGPPRRR